MNDEIRDAIYSACGVTIMASMTWARSTVPDHPRAAGTFSSERSSVRAFKAKLKTFLREIDGTLTATEILDELE